MKFLFSICLAFVMLSGVTAASTAHDGKRDSLLSIAESQVGVRELTNRNDGKQVEQYLASVGLGKGYAWCAAFVTWTFRKAHYTVPSLPMAAQWLTTKKRIPSKDLIPSDLFGVYFNRTVGHVGFIQKVDATKIYTIEGNTNDNGSREGIGVFKRVRLKTRTNLVYSRWT